MELSLFFCFFCATKLNCSRLNDGFIAICTLTVFVVLKNPLYRR